VKKTNPVTQPDGTEMVIFDFAYTLNTRAGFQVPRRGVAGAQIADGAVVGVVLATTSQRFKDLADTFNKCAESFRADKVTPPQLGDGSMI
jgi:hypothetical protein